MSTYEFTKKILIVHALIFKCLYFISSIPVYFIWLRYISWLSYSNEILVINQWKGITDIGCDANATICYKTGEQVIKALSMKEVSDLSFTLSHPIKLFSKKYFMFLKKGNFELNFIILVVLIIGWRILAFLSLQLKAYLKK